MKIGFLLTNDSNFDFIKNFVSKLQNKHEIMIPTEDYDWIKDEEINPTLIISEEKWNNKISSLIDLCDIIFVFSATTVSCINFKIKDVSKFEETNINKLLKIIKKSEREVIKNWKKY